MSLRFKTKSANNNTISLFFKIRNYSTTPKDKEHIFAIKKPDFKELFTTFHDFFSQK